MALTPHKEKLIAAIANPKAKEDKALLENAYEAYEQWIKDLNDLTSKGDNRIEEMTTLLNGYKDYLEVELIAKQGSPFIKRQKGQLKLDNSVLEEFLTYFVHPKVRHT